MTEAVGVQRLLVAYDGTGLSGFQVQPGLRTVQGALEDALTYLARHPVRLAGAGRTDAGVHACGQVVSFPAIPAMTAGRVAAALNGMLPAQLSVLDAADGPEGFHARHHATTRSYTYLIWNHPAPHPFLARYSWQLAGHLDEHRLNRALGVLEGTHDFTSFARLRPDVSPLRTVIRAGASREGHLVRIDIEAESFLHQMVRSIVGTAVVVGEGRKPAGWLAEALIARNRAAAGRVAPPHGLCLTAVGYDDVSWNDDAGPVWPWSRDAGRDPVDTKHMSRREWL